MQYKIKLRFKDRYTKAMYEAGTLVEFDDARAAEIIGILGTSFIEKDEPVKLDKKDEPVKLDKKDEPVKLDKTDKSQKSSKKD